MSARCVIEDAYRAALARCEPYAAVRRALARDGDRVRLGQRWHPLGRRVVLLGAGKAAAPMARAVEDVLGERLDGGVVVTKVGHGAPLARIELLEAAHPTPDESSERAGRRLLDEVARLDGDDTLLFVISGGASALIEVPAPGWTLATLRRRHEELLREELSIEQLNAARTALSALKGGRLTARTAATVLTLVLSDVPTGGPAVVGSGPTLQGDEPGERRDVIVVGDHRAACEAAATALAAHGVEVEQRPGWLSTATARELARELPGVITPEGALVASGETRVQVRGQGRGGRNQELALAAALQLSGRAPTTVGVLATDGQDGPTDAAGAIVDHNTIARMHALGWSPERQLDESDAYPVLDAVGALVRTGPTRTNVNDLLIVWGGGVGKRDEMS